MLTEAQQKRIWAIARAKGWSEMDVKDYLWFRYKVSKTSELTLSNYEFLCYVLETSTPKKAMGME